MDQIFRDLQFTFRSLRKEPAWAFAVLLTLALGIGASTAILSVVDAVLLRPLKFPEPDRLVVLQELSLKRNGEPSRIGPPTFRDWREQSTSLAELAVYTPGGSMAVGDDPAGRATVTAVSPAFFGVLGVEAARGRTFAAEEAVPGHDVAVVSHGFHQRHRVDVGADLRLDGRTWSVVGVLPEGFRFYGGDADVYLPLAFPPDQLAAGMHGARYLDTLGRLAPGVSLDAARRELNDLHDRLGAAEPNLADWDVEVMRWHDRLFAESRPAFLLLLGVAGLVLLIACASVASLLLVRTARRRREMALRGALGASSGRLLRQVLTESVVLAVVAGGLGLLAASWSLDLLVRQIPWSVARLDEVALEHRTFVFTLAVSLACGLLSGLIPAWTGTRSRLNAFLGDGVKSSQSRRTQGLFAGFVVLEIALALVVLVGAGLLTRSFLELRAVDPGLNTEQARVAFLSLPRDRFDEDGRRRIVDDVLGRIRAAGAADAAVATNLPFSGSNMTFSFRLPGVAEDPEGPARIAEYHAVSPGYFDSLEIPRVAGRAFDGRDHAGAPPVAIVNQEMARRFWGDRNPIGQRLRSDHEQVEREVVGVVGDVRHFGRAQEYRPEIYAPYAQDPWPFFNVVATPGKASAAGLPAMLREAIRAADPGLVPGSVNAFADLAAKELAPLRFQMLLVALFGALALVLAASGLYGVVGYAFSQRTVEVAIRLAVGADRRHILGQFLAQGLKLTGSGLLAGTLAALAASRLLGRFLYGVQPWDPLTFMVIAAVLTLVALIATLRPARRATRLDPMAALRRE